MKTTPDTENIKRQCWICHNWFRTAKGSWHILCGYHTQRWNKFKDHIKKQL